MEKRSHILAPHTNVVGEYGVTKSNTKMAKTFVWLPIHQKACERIKHVSRRAVTLSYSDFTIPFKVYT